MRVLHFAIFILFTLGNSLDYFIEIINYNLIYHKKKLKKKKGNTLKYCPALLFQRPNIT